jgi:hypothetical protein
MTPDTAADPQSAPGEQFVRALMWVHGLLRRDLRSLSDLAAEVTAGASAQRVQTAVRSLQTRSPLWQLRINCLRYCHFVHAHHGLEDVQLFPALRRSDPALGPAVDRLESDHRRVSDLLDRVEALSDLLGGDDGAQLREQLVAALTDLGTHLLEHLDFEEETVSPALRRWRQWPM